MKTVTLKAFYALVLLCTTTLFAQQKTVTGTVSEANGPLPGATVIIKGSTVGTQTDFDGKYSIEVSPSDVLQISYVGFKNQESPVGSQSTINFTLEIDNALDEVVIVGYGTQSKEKVIQNVAVINEEALEDIVVNTPDQLLQGQAAGVQVVNSSGLIGSSPSIRVRGLNSINAGSSPLFVLDGVPLTDSDNTLSNGANQGQNPLSFINPNDIESITVLKDAGATVVYGSRGANGVVLITTKKGSRNKKATVTLNTYTQTSNFIDAFDVLEADEYREFKSEVATIQAGETVTPEELGLGAIGSGGTDYLEEITRTGVTFNTDLSVRGGTEKTSYFIGTTYQDAESFALGNSQERIGARVNLSTQANDWLEAGINIGITDTELNVIGQENSVNAPLTSAFLQNPTFLARDADGNFIPSPTFISNIVAVEAQDSDKIETTRTVGNTYLKADIAKGLSVRSEFGVDMTSLQERQRNSILSPFGNSATLINVDERLWRVNQSANYETTFGENHSFGALALMEYEERERAIVVLDGQGFLTDDITNVGGATTQTVTTATRSGSRLFGLLGRVNYDYASKYILEGSIRRDASSRFGANERSATFWSASAGWILSKEKFLENSDVVSYFALRGSIGTAGNDRLGNFPSLGLATAGQYNGGPAIELSSADAPNLTWEESKTLDIGIRSSFFNNRLSLNATYFNKETDRLLLSQTLPTQTGAGTLNINAGALRNSGFEIELSSTNIQTNDFEWRTSLNITTIDNELLNLNADASIDDEGRAFIETGAQRAIVGESLSNFYLIRFSGINSETGDAEWLDADGNITNAPTASDRVITGSALPDFSGGLTNTFKYKNFDLNTLFNFSVGNDVLIDGLRFIDGNDAIGGIGNVRSQNANIWRQPGDNAFLPSPLSSTFNLFNQRSTQQLKDASYLRLKNVTLGYTLPASALEKINLFSNIRLYATATNLFTVKGDDLSGIDPEVNDSSNPLSQGETFFTAPQSRSFLFGASIQF